MIKKIYLTIFILIVIINIQIPIKAETTGIVKLASNKNIIETEEKIEITINISEEKVAAYNAIITFDETKFDIISTPNNSKVEKNQIKLVWYDEKGRKRSKKRRT